MEISLKPTVEMSSTVRFSTEEKEITESSCIIEFQAFRGNDNRYIIKELVFLDLQTHVIYPFLFKPPFPYQYLNSKSKRTNRWLEKHFHHINWNDGFTSYEELDRIMIHFCSRFKRIFVNGLEKQNFVQKITSKEVIQVKIDKTFQSGIDNICVLTKSSIHATSQCAMKNVYRLQLYMQGFVESGGGDGGGGGYISGEEQMTQHEYYSRLRRDNIYLQNDPAESRVSTDIG